jgi:hypothetical protein
MNVWITAGVTAAPTVAVLRTILLPSLDRYVPLRTKRQLEIKDEEYCALWSSKELSRHGEQEKHCMQDNATKKSLALARRALRAANPNERRTSPRHLTSSSAL